MCLVESQDSCRVETQDMCCVESYDMGAALGATLGHFVAHLGRLWVIWGHSGSTLGSLWVVLDTPRAFVDLVVAEDHF